MGDIRTIAQATDARRRGARARRTPARTRRRGADRRPRRAARPGRRARVARPRVHRRPLDAAADRDGGRRSTCSGSPGEPSEQLPWEAVAAAAPEVVVVMPCGYDAERSLLEARYYADELRRSAPGASSRSTPPRRSRGRARDSSTASRCIAHVLHPDRVPAGAGTGARRRALSRLVESPLPPATASAPATEPAATPAQATQPSQASPRRRGARTRSRSACRRSGRRCGRPIEMPGQREAEHAG